MSSGIPITPVDATTTLLFSIPHCLAAIAHISVAFSYPSALQVFAFPLLQTITEALPFSRFFRVTAIGAPLYEVCRIYGRRGRFFLADNQSKIPFAFILADPAVYPICPEPFRGARRRPSVYLHSIINPILSSDLLPFSDSCIQPPRRTRLFPGCHTAQ